MLLGLTLAAAPARAQDRQWAERVWVTVNGGAQSGGSGFADIFETPLYAERERVTVDYPVRPGPVFAASGGYRLWKRITVGAGITRYSRRGNAQVQADLPHPFFDNQFRHVEGPASALRSETSAHVLIGWMQPISSRVRLMLTAGPAFVNVEQTLVTGVNFSEAYPYDTAHYTGAATQRSARSAAGFNAGADLTWMLTPRFGAGAQVQVTRARARLGAGSQRSIAADAGGVQAGAGVRMFF